jgi:Na+/H+-dicarboxylate symporter
MKNEAKAKEHVTIINAPMGYTLTNEGSVLIQMADSFFVASNYVTLHQPLYRVTNIVL